VNIKRQIKEDIKEAMLAGEKEKLQFLRFIYAKIKDLEIEKGRKEIKKEDLIKFLQKELKNLQESLTHFEAAERRELIKKTNTEIKILKAYLPKQMSDEELEKEIDIIIKENKNIDKIGPLIGIAVKQLQGKADSSRIARIVKKKFKK